MIFDTYEGRHVENGAHAEDEEGLNEAEKAMMAAKKRHEDEENAKLVSYEEMRKKEREAEEEELRMLKEKQERRRIEREQEELEQAEKKRKDEERRKEEEEARRARQEEEKRKKEEEKSKRQQMSGASFVAAQGGRNFIIPTKTEKNDKFGNIVQAKQEMGMTKEQQEEAKKAFMIGIRQSIPEASAISASDLKAKIKELHQRICKLETDKYDLEKRHERQEYDLKELNERSRQVARNATGGKKGDVDGDGRFPPKVQVVSKYDRQIDRRNFKERRQVYENLTRDREQSHFICTVPKTGTQLGLPILPLLRLLSEKIQAFLLVLLHQLGRKTAIRKAKQIKNL
ncbi:hypothetical protein TELCIR_09004 [Teladorsagia circumcincta]|uniref:Troponin T family protein n=1 Tax=Teladorsagia circumcincta TaxID=45464 RepID=A0A2G9UG23_TELCI|nr:hypothetical protein TELCIR_09004 [Teladorsagia circumcincta]